MPFSGGGGIITSSAQIIDGIIVNADINASAAIAYSKLALTGSIVNADVSASAAIAYSKLALSASIVNADVATGAAIAFNKLATGTQGGVLVIGASGVVTDIGAGSNGQVLKSGGASVTPAWGAAGGASLINTYSIGNVASYAITGLASYGIYVFSINSMSSVNNGATLRIEIGTGATPTYSTTYQISGSSGSVAQNPQGVVIITAGNDTNGNCIMCNVVSNGTNYVVPVAGAGNGAAITAFRFSFSAGNIASGSVTLQGI